MSLSSHSLHLSIARTRWLVLGFGLAMMLVGAFYVMWSSSGSDVSGVRVSMAYPQAAESIAYPQVTESMASPQEADTLPKASGGMVLIGTILSTKPADIRALIANAQGQQRVYALGDVISDGSKLVEIERDYVVLFRYGHREILEFSWNAVIQILERATHTAQNVNQETTPGVYPEVLLNAMLTHPGLLLQMVGATPVMEGKSFSGYRVMKPENTAFLESLGLKPGDILTAVNGVPLNTPDYGAGLLDSLSGTGRVTFTVRRGSEIRVLGH